MTCEKKRQLGKGTFISGSVDAKISYASTEFMAKGIQDPFPTTSSSTTFFPPPSFPLPSRWWPATGERSSHSWRKGKKGGEKEVPSPLPHLPHLQHHLSLARGRSCPAPRSNKEAGQRGADAKERPGDNFFGRVLTARRNWPSEIRGHSPVLWVPGRPGIPISGANSPECAGYWPMNWRCPRMARPPSVRPLEISLAFSLLFSLSL